MGQKYLIDTNVISHLFADRLPENGKEFVATILIPILLFQLL
jgi:hypothetical protein